MNDLQFILKLPKRNAFGREDFFVSPANSLAVKMLDSWEDRTECALALIGSEHSGKSHLVSVWSTAVGAKIIQGVELADIKMSSLLNYNKLAIEDIDTIENLAPANRWIAEENLLHSYNAVSSGQGKLLVTGKVPPSSCRFLIPDLSSRLESVLVAKMMPPDDSLLTALMIKLFEDRQMIVSPDAIKYSIPRIDRSFSFMKLFVQELDTVSLQRKKPISIVLINDVLRTLEISKEVDKN